MEHRIEKNDEGVSPVIAVILMVAITVVLAAVLRLGSQFPRTRRISPYSYFLCITR